MTMKYSFRHPLKLTILLFFVLFPFFNIMAQQDSVQKEIKSNFTQEEEIFMICQEMPRFPGCENADSKMDKAICAYKKMMLYINERLKYPEDAKNNLIEGKVIVRFVVTKDGNIASPVVIEDIGFGCGQEVVRVVETMNNMPVKWIPGKQKGENVNVSLNVPVEFKMTERLKAQIRLKNPANLDTTKEEVLEEAEEMPRFPGCEPISSKVEKENCATLRLIDYIQTRLILTEEAKLKGFNGKVIVKFIVRKDGYVSNCEIIKDMEGGFGDQVKNIIDNMNKKNIRWIPGKNKGNPVNVFLTIPIYFKRDAVVQEKK
jgi:TonB family protein